LNVAAVAVCDPGLELGIELIRFGCPLSTSSNPEKGFSVISSLMRARTAIDFPPVLNR
jgi:hypothetical protein